MELGDGSQRLARRGQGNKVVLCSVRKDDLDAGFVDSTYPI